MEKSSKAILIVVIGALLFFGTWYVISRPDTTQDTEVVTQGNRDLIPPSWIGTKDSATGISFTYPPSFPTKYITAVDWPPKVQLLDEKFNCTPAGEIQDRAGQTFARTLDGKPYCVTVAGEGAAGSVYLQFAYATALGDKTVILTFSTRETQCMNYDDPQKSECIAERNAFKIDALMAGVFRTLSQE